MSLIFFLKSRVFQLTPVGNPLKIFTANNRAFGFRAIQRTFLNTSEMGNFIFRARVRPALIAQPAQRITLIKPTQRTFNFEAIKRTTNANS